MANASSLRVLVVDDNHDTALGLSLVLQNFGHQVRTAHDGGSVLAAALEYRPHVVLLDIGLPGLDGYGVAKQICNQPALNDVVLVAITGHGHEADQQRVVDDQNPHGVHKLSAFEAATGEICCPSD